MANPEKFPVDFPWYFDLENIPNVYVPFPSGTITVAEGVRHSEKYSHREYPVAEGLTGGSTKQKGRVSRLQPVRSFVKKRELIGL